MPGRIKHTGEGAIGGGFDGGELGGLVEGIAGGRGCAEGLE
jgi:hypothetical protein